MKSKILVIATTLLMALAMMAQTATQATPAAPADKANTCACCNHDKADAKPGEKMECCGKDGGCCKDGKCDMKAHKDGKMTCCSGDKCPMMSQKDGKAGCCGDKCPMMKSGKTTAEVSCCAKGAACCKGGAMPCCSRDKVVAHVTPAGCCGNMAEHAGV
jgi:hypothetical protein